MTATNIVLPNLGFGMEEGRLIRWLKQPGESVHKGEPIAEIESDKTNVELESTVDGIVMELCYPADTVIPVGATLAKIQTEIHPSGSSGEAAFAPLSTVAPESPRVTPLARRMIESHGVDTALVKGTGNRGAITQADIRGMLTTPPNAQPAQPNGSPLRPLAAPATKQLAREYGIDLRLVAGTGTEGRITRADVAAAIEAQALPPVVEAERPTAMLSTPPPTPSQSEIPSRTKRPFEKMRQTIAARLTQSMQTAPHIYVNAELDLTPALRNLPAGIGINALMLYSVVQTLKAAPALNATFEDGDLYGYPNVNLAIAVALPSGLITPVLHRADDYSLSGLADRARDLINRARDGKLKPQELGGGTFTVSNLGTVKQVDRFTAILNPPQIGILAIGAAKERPFVIDGGLHVRTTVHLTLSVDHRAVDGMQAALFLEQFDGQLQAFARQ